jgi:hypothetical protein
VTAALVNSRYVAYAAAHGETPDGMLATDRERWKGGNMTGFTIWIDGKWREWCAANFRPRSALTDADHVAFDAWLLS